MAKKKAASTSGKRASAPRKTAAPKSPAGKKVVPTKPAPTLTEEDIGHTAGDVWRVLFEGGGQTTAALKKSVDAPGDLVMAAVGWLAREEKLQFTSTGRTVKVALR